MKRILLLILMFYLLGCTPQVNIDTQNTDITTLPDPISSIDHFAQSKGYITLLNKYHANTVNTDYTFTLNDSCLTLTNDSESIKYTIFNKEIEIHAKEQITYLKNDIQKNAELKLIINNYEHGNLVTGELYTQDGIVYQILLFNDDDNKYVLQNNDPSSNSYGNTMFFIKELEQKIIDAFVSHWKQSVIYSEILYTFVSDYKSYLDGEKVEEIPNAIDHNWKVTTPFKSFSFDRKLLDVHEVFPSHISINEDFFTRLSEATPLQQILALAANIQQEFDTIDKLDLVEAMPAFASISSYGGCLGSTCHIHDREFPLEFAMNYSGYTYLFNRKDVNHTVAKITGIQEAYPAMNKVSLFNGFIYDNYLDGFLGYAPDGDFASRDPGVIILDQTITDVIEEYTVVFYEPFTIDGHKYINDILVDESELDEWTYPGDELRSAYRWTMDHLDRFDKWKIQVIFNQSSNSYKLLSMRIISE